MGTYTCREENGDGKPPIGAPTYRSHQWGDTYVGNSVETGKPPMGSCGSTYVGSHNGGHLHAGSLWGTGRPVGLEATNGERPGGHQ
jgi:hypothetical protein